ncbi:DUF6049 family protein [Cryobacterium fucosi]|uniref:Uncharacterized protein n=1 Tax=Cryobacterium fucosi TaxID=1259157 RepID=A0A4R9BB93_9MICO|nr:DUF6049 family protein [Cryobacterium fucosi]TFD78333.1 hypothetical protein E3T48_07835 [Cryobacterium fucosi]
MVADSVPARRPALPEPRSGRRRPVGALLGAVLALVLTAATPLAAIAGPAASPTGQARVSTSAVPPNSVSIAVAPVSLKPLRVGEDLTVTVTIKNGTADPIAPGTIDLYLADRALTSRSALNNWLHPEKAGKPGDLMKSEAMKAPVQPDSTEIITVIVPADSVGLTAGNAWGARGIAVTLTNTGDIKAQGRGTFIWYSDEELTPVNVAVVMPITAPEQTTGLIPEKALETFTGPTGVLTRQLEGVIDRPVAIAIDPQIIVSIRILGSSAPPGAIAWLDRLAQARNEIFPLSYADADLALQTQSGAASLLAPTSFDQAIDSTLFATPTATGTPTATATAPPAPSSVPAPSATPTQPPGPVGGAAPTTEQLLAWNYTATDIGWPHEGSVAAADLPVFAAGGLSTTILAGSNATQSDGDITPNTAVSLGAAAGTGLVADDPLSEALRTAALSTSDDAWREAMAEVGSQLAVVSAEKPGTTRTLLATFDRGWPPSAGRLSQTLDALAALSWQAPATLTAARSATTVDVKFEGRTEPADRVELAKRLLVREAEVVAFSSALTVPLTVTADHRITLLSLLSNSWASQPGSWRDAVDTSLVDSSALLRSVSVSTKGPINVLGSKVDIPVTLDNALGQAVTVRVQVVPSNGRLLVGGDVESTIEAQSARTVLVPVTSAVGNGAVTLRVTLFTPAGTMIDQPALIPINVRADWEGLGSLIFAAAVVLFFGFGVWRNILRRRRDREEPATATDPAAAGAPTASSNDPGTEPHA